MTDEPIDFGKARAARLADKYITRDGDAVAEVTPLDEVECFTNRYIAYPSEHARVAHVLWIAHTYLMEKFDTTPRLAFMSAEKMSGKTRALIEVTPLLVHAPVSSVGDSAAVMIRVASQEGGCTLLYDEIDAV